MNDIVHSNWSDQNNNQSNSGWNYSSTNIVELSESVVEAAKYIYSTLMPGLPKCVYQLKLFNFLVKKGFQLEMESSMLNHCAECEPNRELIIVNNSIVIECIFDNDVTDHHQKRIIFDLQNRNNSLGLLLNFGSDLQGIELKKVFNNTCTH